MSENKKASELKQSDGHIILLEIKKKNMTEQLHGLIKSKAYLWAMTCIGSVSLELI